jgi:glycosyltransferase involved in cell wall biosynthesis
MLPTEFCEIPDSNIKKRLLSILMPFHNEEDVIVANTHKVIHDMGECGYNFEIILIDDGSTDYSYSRLKDEFIGFDNIKVVRNFRNFGKGWALKTGYEFSSGDYILFLDSDLELSPLHINNFFRIMCETGADAVIGSKLHKDSVVDYPGMRRIFSVGYYSIVRLLFGLPILDSQTGIKLFIRFALEASLPKLIVKKFAFDIELLLLLSKNGFKIVPAPIELNFSRIAQGRVKLKTVFNMFFDTLAVYYREKILRFYDRPLGGNVRYFYSLILFSKTGDEFEKFALERFLNINYPDYDVFLLGKTDFGIIDKRLRFIKTGDDSFLSRANLLCKTVDLKSDYVLFSTLEAYPDERFLFHTGRVLSIDGVSAVGGFVTLRRPYSNFERLAFYTIRSVFLNAGLSYRYKPVRSREVAELQINGIFAKTGIIRKIDYDADTNLKFEYIIARTIHKEQGRLMYSPDLMLYSRFPQNFKDFMARIKNDAISRSLQRRSAYFHGGSEWRFFTAVLFLLFVVCSLIFSIVFNNIFIALPLIAYYSFLFLSMLFLYSAKGFAVFSLIFLAQFVYSFNFIMGLFKK